MAQDCEREAEAVWPSLRRGGSCYRTRRPHEAQRLALLLLGSYFFGRDLRTTTGVFCVTGHISARNKSEGDSPRWPFTCMVHMPLEPRARKSSRDGLRAVVLLRSAHSPTSHHSLTLSADTALPAHAPSARPPPAPYLMASPVPASRRLYISPHAVRRCPRSPLPTPRAHPSTAPARLLPPHRASPPELKP